MTPRLRVLWLASALIPAAVASGALPHGERSPLQSPEPIGFLYINEGTTDRSVAGGDNVVSGLAALADGSLAGLPGAPWRPGGKGPPGARFVASARIGLCAGGRRPVGPHWGGGDVAALSAAGD